MPSSFGFARRQGSTRRRRPTAARRQKTNTSTIAAPTTTITVNNNIELSLLKRDIYTPNNPSGVLDQQVQHFLVDATVAVGDRGGSVNGGGGGDNGASLPYDDATLSVISTAMRALRSPSTPSASPTAASLSELETTLYRSASVGGLDHVNSALSELYDEARNGINIAYDYDFDDALLATNDANFNDDDYDYDDNNYALLANDAETGIGSVFQTAAYYASNLEQQQPQQQASNVIDELNGLLSAIGESDMLEKQLTDSLIAPFDPSTLLVTEPPATQSPSNGELHDPHAMFESNSTLEQLALESRRKAAANQQLETQCYHRTETDDYDGLDELMPIEMLIYQQSLPTDGAPNSNMFRVTTPTTTFSACAYDPPSPPIRSTSPCPPPKASYSSALPPVLRTASGLRCIVDDYDEYQRETESAVAMIVTSPVSAIIHSHDDHRDDDSTDHDNVDLHRESAAAAAANIEVLSARNDASSAPSLLSSFALPSLPLPSDDELTTVNVCSHNATTTTTTATICSASSADHSSSVTTAVAVACLPTPSATIANEKETRKADVAKAILQHRHNMPAQVSRKPPASIANTVAATSALSSTTTTTTFLKAARKQPIFKNTQQARRHAERASKRVIERAMERKKHEEGEKKEEEEEVEEEEDVKDNDHDDNDDDSDDDNNATIGGKRFCTRNDKPIDVVAGTRRSNRVSSFDVSPPQPNVMVDDDQPSPPTTRPRRKRVSTASTVAVTCATATSVATTSADDVFVKPLSVDSRFWKKRMQNRMSSSASASAAVAASGSAAAAAAAATQKQRSRPVRRSSRAVSSSDESEIEFSSMPLHARVNLLRGSILPSPPATLNVRMQQSAADFLAVVDLNAIHDNLYDRHVNFLRRTDLTATKCRVMKKVLRRDRFRIRQIHTLIDNVAWVVYYYFLAEHQLTKRMMLEKMDSAGQQPTDDNLPKPDKLFSHPLFLSLQPLAARRIKKRLPETGFRNLDQKLLRHFRTLFQLLNDDSARSSATLRPPERDIFVAMDLYRETDCRDSIFPLRTVLVPTKQYVRSYLYQVLRCRSTNGIVAADDDSVTEPDEPDSTRSYKRYPKHRRLVTWKEQYERFYYTLNYLAIINYKFMLFSHHCDVLEGRFNKSPNDNDSATSGLDALPTTYWSHNPDLKSRLNYLFYSVVTDKVNTSTFLDIAQPSPSVVPPATPQAMQPSSPSPPPPSLPPLSPPAPKPSLSATHDVAAAAASSDIQLLLADQLKMAKLLVDDLEPSQPSETAVAVASATSRRTNDQFSRFERTVLRTFFMRMDVQKKQHALNSVCDTSDFLFSTLERLYCKALETESASTPSCDVSELVRFPSLELTD